MKTKTKQNKTKKKKLQITVLPIAIYFLNNLLFFSGSFSQMETLSGRNKA